MNKLPETATDPFTGNAIVIRDEFIRIANLCKTDRSDALRILSSKVVIPPETDSLAKFLFPFFFFNPLYQLAFKVDFNYLEQMAYLFGKRQYESKCVYTEVRYSPFLFLPEDEQADVVDSDGRSLLDRVKEVVFSVSRGLRRAETDFSVCDRNIEIDQIFCCICFNPEWSMPSVDLLDFFREHDAKINAGNNDSSESANSTNVLVKAYGIDIATAYLHFDEENHPELHKSHSSACKKAKDLGFQVNLHAGESCNEIDSKHVLQAISDTYGNAKRIGHGYAIQAMLEKELENGGTSNFIDTLKSRNVHFEICPMSSKLTGSFILEKNNWKAHPLTKIKEAGLSFGINTDDPSVMGSSLNDEWELVLNNFAGIITRGDFLQMSLDSIACLSCLSQLDKCEGARKKADLESFFRNWYDENLLQF